MKYQKPAFQDLSELSFAEGACLSGALVGTCDPNGITAGWCLTNGVNAGTCSSPGGTVTPAVCAGAGSYGLGTNCAPTGGIATP
jgi:hypothetical protein